MIKYFEKWFQAKKQPILPLTDAEAAEKHLSGDAYIAVVDRDAGKCVVDVAGIWVSILFLDSTDRVLIAYDFKKIEGGMSFLSLASHFEYENSENRPSRSVIFSFKTDGRIFIESRDISTGDIQKKESFADPKGNWEPSPNFGEYGSICRIER